MKEPTGILDIVFRRKTSGVTYVAKQFFKLPMQVLSPYYPDEDGTAFLYLLNPSGGILQHDRLLTRIHVEEKARALVTTPSSTKFYKMDEGYALLENHVTVERGGVLEYLPEYSVPFTQSKACQENYFYLDEEATLVAMDLMASGRGARGEAFQYDLYASQTKVYVGGKLMAFDKCLLEPAKMDLRRVGMLEGFSAHGTLYIYKKGAAAGLASAICAMESCAMKNPRQEVCFSASAVNESLTVVKLLGQGGSALQEAVHMLLWPVIRESLLGKPAVRIRKY